MRFEGAAVVKAAQKSDWFALAGAEFGAHRQGLEMVLNNRKVGTADIDRQAVCVGTKKECGIRSRRVELLLRVKL